MSRAVSESGTPRRRELGEGSNRQFDPSSTGNNDESHASVRHDASVLGNRLGLTNCVLMCRRHPAAMLLAQCKSYSLQVCIPDSNPIVRIWGTNVNIDDTLVRARRFLREFTDEDGLEPRYQRLIKQVGPVLQQQEQLTTTNLILLVDGRYRRVARRYGLRSPKATRSRVVSSSRALPPSMSPHR
jgi:hypothetical protein